MFDARQLMVEVCLTTASDAGTEVVVANTCRALANQLSVASKSISGYITSGILHASPPSHDHNTLEHVASSLRSLGDQCDCRQIEAILALAAIIRKVDGSNSKGAADLAEAILSDPDTAKIFGGNNNA